MGKPLTGKPVPVVVIDGHSFKLDETALSKILLDPRVKDRPVVVVSVAGAFRKGKSFLLNIFLRYLNAPKDSNWLGNEDSPLDGFSWSGGHKLVTTGILMWSEPFIIKRGEGQVAVLLMDTQGTFDTMTTTKNCSTIFALSTLLSSVQIYNLSMNIQEDDLQYLQYFVEYGRLALESNSDLKPFQSLQFLVRDWPDEDYEHGEVGGMMLLEEVFSVNEQSELNQIRKHIKSCFETIDCYLMPYPGSKVTSGKYNGRLENMEENFKKYVKIYTDLLLRSDNLVVKKINGGIVTGKGLLGYCKAYMNIFKTLPEPKSAFAATVEANNLVAVDNARDLYYKEMESICARGKSCLNLEQLEREHQRCVEMALDSFNQTPKMGDADVIKQYAANLKLNLEKLYEGYREKQAVFLSEANESNMAAVAMAMGVYSRKMGRICAPDKPYLKPEQLEREHQRCVEMALDSFNQTRKIGGAEFSEQYEEKLELELQALYKKYIKRNDSKPHNTFWENVAEYGIRCAATAVRIVFIIIFIFFIGLVASSVAFTPVAVASAVVAVVATTVVSWVATKIGRCCKTPS